MSESGQVISGREALQIHRLAVTLEDAPAEPPPAWIELIPAGEFNGRDGRGPYRLDDASRVAAATSKLRMDAGIPIDYDHATDFAAPEGRPAPAAGWIKELAEREGALWGRVEWTQHGAAALATKEYRYISPVFEHDADGVVVRLLRAALTNNPNLYLKAIAAREQSSGGGGKPSQGGNAQQEAGGADDVGFERLRQLCGLSPGVSDEEIIATLRRGPLAETGQRSAQPAIERAQPSASNSENEADYVAAGAFQATARELCELRERSAEERTANAVETAIRSGKLVPAQREWALSYCRADYQGFQQFVARQPRLALNVAAVEGKPRRRSWADGMPEEMGPGGELSAIEWAVCSRLGIGREQFAKRKAARASAGAHLSSFVEV
jgi:phage I-like protein